MLKKNTFRLIVRLDSIGNQFLCSLESDGKNELLRRIKDIKNLNLTKFRFIY